GGQRDELAFVALGGLDMVVDLNEVGRLAAHGRAVIDDLYLQFFGGLIDNGHNVYLVLRSSSAASLASSAVGSRSPTRPNAAKYTALIRNIFHGTLPTVNFKLFNAPIRNSRVLWATRSKICGKKAATVSGFNSGGTCAATFKPSGNAITAPTTPGMAMARSTISLGVANRFLKSVSGACDFA